jgi:hypothetical protein
MHGAIREPGYIFTLAEGEVGPRRTVVAIGLSMSQGNAALLFAPTATDEARNSRGSAAKTSLASDFST